MKNLLLSAVMFALTVMMVGCARSPRLNLANLGNGSYVPTTERAVYGNDGFKPGQAPNFQEIKTAEVGKEEQIAPAGNWVAETETLIDDQGFLKNPQEWQERVYFAYNRNDIRTTERKVLDDLAAYLQENGDIAVVIEGHADQRGEEEYNRALGERRALAVRDYLKTLGIALNRMSTISYGEDRPAYPNAQSESEWKMNRRVQFLIGYKK